jgi:hypothetical protein
LKQEANRKQKITKKNQTIHTKREVFKNNDLKKKPNEKIRRLLMSFTRVSAQSDKREKSSGSIPSSQQEKKLKIREKVTKYEQKVPTSQKTEGQRVIRKIYSSIKKLSKDKNRD